MIIAKNITKIKVYLLKFDIYRAIKMTLVLMYLTLFMKMKKIGENRNVNKRPNPSSHAYYYLK